MSESKSLDLEDKNQVVITPEDAQECAKFFEFFEIPVPTALKVAFDQFIAEPNIVNQNELRFQLSDIVANGDHPVFKDDVFKQVRPEVAGVREDLVFERQLEAMVTSSADE